MNKKTILVSGASGLLGSELVLQLLNNSDYNVIALTSQKDNLENQFKQKKLDVLHVKTWKDDIDPNIKIDTLINCAFPRSSKPEQLAAGLLFTENIIKNAISLNTKSIINISSQSVYSQKTKEVTDEFLTVAPESLYGMAKYASERLVKTICNNFKKKVPFANIRLASLTGLDFDVRMTNRFVKNALSNKPITINGGNQLISYLEVRDAAAALIQMIKVNPYYWNEIYNLGNNESFSLIELTNTVKAVAANHSSNEVEIIKNEGQDNFNNLISSELFYTDFNWKPKFDLQTMIEELFIHYKHRV